MGCIATKTNHIDSSETESTISTVSQREKTLSYDDYWTEQEKQEEREIEAELEGKKIPYEKSPPKYSQEPNPKGNKVSASHKSRKELSLNKEKVPLVNSDKGKEGNDNVNDVKKARKAKDSGKHNAEKNNRSSASEINDTKKQRDNNTVDAEQGDRQTTKTSEKFRQDRGESVDERKKVGNRNTEKHSANGRERSNITRARQTSATKSKGKSGTDETNTNRKLTELANENLKVNSKTTREKKENQKDKIQNNSKQKESKSETEPVRKNGTLQNNNILKESVEKQHLLEDEKDSVDGTIVSQKESSHDDDDSIIDKSEKDNSEDIKMGNTESNAEVKLNGHTELPDKDAEKIADEQSDDHHVHWKDDSKVMNGQGKTSVRVASAKLMPQPSERVMSAHVRRGSLRQSAGKERRMSRGMSARRDRSASARYSARRQRRESKTANETNGKDISSDQ